MLQTLKISDFEPFLNQEISIRFHHPDATLQAELIDVHTVNSYSAPGSERAPFSITLLTQQQGQHYIQAIYTVEHPKLGDIEVFMVPLGPDPARGGMRYEVIFN